MNKVIDKNKALQKEKYLWAILKKMCEFVNVSIDKIDFNSDTWFQTHKWSLETESKFVEWLQNYLYNNYQARKNIMQTTIKNKTFIKKFAEMFAFNYGWSLK